MPDQGPAPLLNRAWARRGWASPPHFGQTVPGIMAETTVTFERRALTPNNIGGFTGGGWATIWEVPAHVELSEERRQVGSEAGGTVGYAVYRHYDIYIDLDDPPDPDAIPIKGDRVTFSDGLVQRSNPVNHVSLNAGLLDHLEIQTDEWLA